MERTRRELVAFLRPFSLPGVEEQQRPGTYTVEVIEEPIDGLSFVAYRRVSTTIILPSPQYGYAAKQAVTIDPRDLEAAKRKDSEAAAAAVGRPLSPHLRALQTESKGRAMKDSETDLR